MKTGLRIGLIIILTTHITFLFSQNFWEQLYFPDTVHIRCITTNESGDIFVGVGYDNQTGGVYRSTDNGQSWDLAYDNGVFGVLSIAINEEGYIYVGKNGFDRFIVSKDNGESWENIELPSPSYGNVLRIFCVGQDTIYISTWETMGSFITYSFNGGATWQYSYVNDHPNEYVSDIDISSTGEIFVSTNGFFWDQGGVYKSDDAGENWEYVGLLNHQVHTLELNSNNEVFTGDWWVINNDWPGIHALYEGTNTFDLIFDAYYVTDIVIDPNETIYAAANEGVVYSLDNGLSFNQIEDNLSTTIEFLHIGSNGYLYGIRFNRIVKSIDPIITGTSNLYYNRKTDLVITYPNPTYNILKVYLSSKSITDNFCKVYIYDVYGKVVYKNEDNFNSNCFSMDVSLFAAGYYLVVIRQNDKIYKSSFVKN